MSNCPCLCSCIPLSLKGQGSDTSPEDPEINLVALSAKLESPFPQSNVSDSALGHHAQLFVAPSQDAPPATLPQTTLSSLPDSKLLRLADSHSFRVMRTLPQVKGTDDSWLLNCLRSRTSARCHPTLRPPWALPGCWAPGRLGALSKDDALYLAEVSAHLARAQNIDLLADARNRKPTAILKKKWMLSPVGRSGFCSFSQFGRFEMGNIVRLHLK